MATGSRKQDDSSSIRAEADRLQPALIYRLTDDEPDRTSEPANRAVVNKAALKRHVLQDLSWLLNTTSYEIESDLEQYPEVRKSVINYGVPPLAGRAFSSVDWADVERSLHQAILRFEPRILPDSLKITAIAAADKEHHHSQLQIELRGEIWSIPMPIDLLLRTRLDLETGQVTVTDQLARALG